MDPAATARPGPAQAKRPAPLGLAVQYLSTRTLAISLAATGAAGTFLRLWHINSLGFNSDEAVYAGQAAAIAGDPALKAIFPIFRAHPLLFQFVLSLLYGWSVGDLLARLLAVAFGIATVFVVYRLGALLYGRSVGLLGAVFMALMPYHVIVSRQALLDVPMTFFAAVALLFLARFAATERPGWLYATAGALGLTFLSKETGIVLLPAIYAFLALSPSIRVRFLHVALSLLSFLLVIAPFPVSLKLGGATSTAHSFLVWQLFRRANHVWNFYVTTVPFALGILLVVAAGYGLWRRRDEITWKRRLLLSWIAVPFMFFQLWPVKGFQYLLPVAPAIAILAARGVLLAVPATGLPRLRLSPSLLRFTAIGAVTISLFATSWLRINSVNANEFLAGSGGVPGGRAAGEWLQTHIPAGSTLLTIGPSMANILEFYGHHRAYGLSVSPNPLHRNPAYDPVINPDFLLRSGEIQYVVWDAYSTARSSFFANKLLRYASRYHGRVIHIETVDVKIADGASVDKPVIVVYEVWP